MNVLDLRYLDSLITWVCRRKTGVGDEADFGGDQIGEGLLDPKGVG